MIVFETKADLSPLEVFMAYAKRWGIEIMFSLYKDIIELDTVNVHSDYSIYTTELINYLSVHCRKSQKALNSTALHIQVEERCC